MYTIKDLQTAIIKNDTNKARLILASDLDISAKVNTLAVLASRWNQPTLIVDIINKGVDLNKVGVDLLKYSVRSDNVDLFQFLYKKGVTTDFQNLLYDADKFASIRVFKAIKNLGVKSYKARGQALIRVIKMKKHLPMTEEASGLDLSKDICTAWNISDDYYAKAIELSIAYYNCRVTRYLYSVAPKRVLNTVLPYVIKRRDGYCLQDILDAGVDVTYNNSSALLVAEKYSGHAVKKLIELAVKHRPLGR